MPLPQVVEVGTQVLLDVGVCRAGHHYQATGRCRSKNMDEYLGYCEYQVLKVISLKLSDHVVGRLTNRQSRSR
jgi:hypothetical protein